MSSPQFGDVTGVMSIKGLIFWGVVGAVGVVGLSSLFKPDAPVTTLEQTLGATVEITRL